MKDGSLGYINVDDVFCFRLGFEMKQNEGIPMTESDRIISFKLMTIFK